MNNEESKVTINTKPIEYYISQIVSEPQLVEQKMPMCVVHESTKEALAVDDAIYDSVQLIEEDKKEQGPSECNNQQQTKGRLANRFCLSLNCFDYS